MMRGAIGGRDRGEAIGMVFGEASRVACGVERLSNPLPISIRSRYDLARTSLSACSSSTNEP